ncbi:MAG: T9SS type A sorting domain-containing protein, partial [Bacteroidetes bacterium]|nr:T9SS type A sorting domain-containing protein [Bacteroidota bacterium]
NNVTSNPYIISAYQGGTYQITALSDSSKTGTCFSGIPTITVDSIIPSSNITSGVNTICSGDSTNIPISLTGTAPWSLTYTIGGLNPTTVENITTSPYLLTATQAGTYQVTDISGVGCKGSIITGSATINVNPSTTYAYATSICDATSYTLGTQTLTTAGTYTEKFTASNGCDSVVTLTLNVKPQISEMQEATICNATSFAFGTQTLSSGGIYTEKFIAANGCDSLVTLTLIVTPAISEEITATTCEGSPFTFGSQTLSNAGTYTETFTSAAGCDSVVLLTLNVNSLSTATISSGNANICNGGTANITIDFTGVPPWDFTYTIDNTSPATITYVSDNPYILPVTQAGTYALTNLTGAGCIGTTDPLAAVITIYPTISINATDSVCNNSSYVFGTQILTATGVYNELFVSSNGCDSTVTLDLTVVAEPVPQYTFNSTGLVVTFVNSTLNADTYSWDFGDGNTSTLPNPVYTYGTPGIYIVDLTASNTFCGTVTLSDTVNLLALSPGNTLNENSIRIYPNPTSGNITIECGNAFQSEITIDIYSVTGQKIYTNTFDSKNKNQKVNLSDFANGMYTIKILTSNFVKTERIILNR